MRTPIVSIFIIVTTIAVFAGYQYGTLEMGAVQHERDILFIEKKAALKMAALQTAEVEKIRNLAKRAVEVAGEASFKNLICQKQLKGNTEKKKPELPKNKKSKISL